MKNNWYYKNININIDFDCLREMYFHIQKNLDDNLIRQTSRGFSIDINYVKKYKQFKSLFNIEKQFSHKHKRLRFHVNSTISKESWKNIHIDKVDGEQAYASIIFPLINANNKTITSWYNLKKGKLKEASNAIGIDKSIPYEVESVYNTSFLDNVPVLCRVNQLHNVSNQTNKDRIVVAWFIEQKDEHKLVYI